VAGRQFLRSPLCLFACAAALGACGGGRSSLEPEQGRPVRKDAPDDAAPAAPATSAPRLCVFDYDLTLSSNRCDGAQGDPALSCRENACITYDWYSQCLGLAAREAVAECVRRGAYIGIASHANADYCWADKVQPIIAERQFPELLDAPGYANPARAPSYPALDVRENWNCEDCAYTMDGGVSKPVGIQRVMRHYGMDPSLAADRARVIFWDDEPGNVQAVERELPEARAVLVPRFGSHGSHGGCGIRREDIAAGWAP